MKVREERRKYEAWQTRRLADLEENVRMQKKEILSMLRMVRELKRVETNLKKYHK